MDDLYGEKINIGKYAEQGGAKLLNFLLERAIEVLDLQQAGWTPVHHKDIALRPAAEQAAWYAAEVEELNILRKHGVINDAERLPPGRKPIGCRWVYMTKSDGRRKAHLVAQGFSQVEGKDFDWEEVFSPVIRYETVRMTLALAALENWHVSFLDVKSAYLYGKLSEEIYMKQPPGYVLKGDNASLVFRLHRALYGLKQGAHAWWKELDGSMTEFGFKRCHSDAGIFVHHAKNGDIVIADIYVDDAMWLGNNVSLVKEKMSQFTKRWESHVIGDLTDGGPTMEFLSLQIKREGKLIFVNQNPYCSKVLVRFQMENSRKQETPLPGNYTCHRITVCKHSNPCTDYYTAKHRLSALALLVSERLRVVTRLLPLSSE